MFTQRIVKFTVTRSICHIHREDGPAIEYKNGDKEWWYKGQRHREDGPAVVYKDGTVKYFLMGSLMKTKEDYDRYVANGILCYSDMKKW